MPLVAIHDRLWITAAIYSAVVGLWAFYRAFQQQDLDSNFWGALVINELIFIVQAILGAIVLLQNAQAARWVHYLYVVVGVITLPAAYAFTHGRGTRQEASTYGLVCLFLMGIAIRAVTTIIGPTN